MTITGGEFGFIRRIRKWIGAGGKDVVLGIGDDAAILNPPPGKLLAACDMLVEDVHFVKEYTGPWQLGWKALAVNISDIAAMGGVPLFALVSMGLADWVDDAYIESVYKGMLDIARQYGVELVGGDTVSSPKAMVVNVAILGSANSPVTRSGARPGHLIAVTGCLGRSAAGLACLRRIGQKDRMIRNRIGDVGPGVQQPVARVGVQAEGHGEVQPEAQANLSGAPWIRELIKAHLEPIPRVSEGRALASTGVVSAMLDISDGLAGEAHQIARESKVGVALREEAVPIGESTRHAATLLECDALEWALSGGEDFELVFTFPPESTDTVRDALSNAGGSMYIVGHITRETEGVVLVGSDGTRRRIPFKGYDHFD